MCADPQKSFPSAQLGRLRNIVRWYDYLQHTADPQGVFPRVALKQPPLRLPPPVFAAPGSKVRAWLSPRCCHGCPCSTLACNTAWNADPYARVPAFMQAKESAATSADSKASAATKAAVPPPAAKSGAAPAAKGKPAAAAAPHAAPKAGAAAPAAEPAAKVCTQPH